MRIIDKNIEEIRALCNRHRVARLFVFSSILTDNFKKSSDIDLLVDFSGVDLYDYAENYFDLKTSLEKLLKRQVDLLEDKAVKNPYLRKSIDSSKKMIYG
jgi:predicted nucleotidyltransferase